MANQEREQLWRQRVAQLQATTPGRFLPNVRSQLFDVRLRVIERGRDCAGLRGGGFF